MKKKLVVNADDFGYSEGINKGLIYAHKNGLVTSASLFVDKPGTDNAVALAKENPTLGIGLHVDLDSFFEIDHSIGVFTAPLPGKFNIDEVNNELKRQLDKFFSFGLTADHIDSHHHAHMHKDVFPLLAQLAKEKGIKVIRLFKKNGLCENNFDELKTKASDYNLKTVDHMIEGWYWGNVDENYQIAELMTHPGYGDLWREAELAHCCQPSLKEYFAKNSIDLLRFSEVF